MFPRAVALAAFLTVSTVPLAQAQAWRFTVSPYLLLPNMSGRSGVGDLVVDIDANPGDIFERLQFGAMLVAEANNGTWGVALDGIYMDLEQDGAAGPLTGTAGATQGAIELAGFRRVAPWAELLLGGRFNHLSLTLASHGPQGRSAEDGESWVDPIVGARLRAPNTGKWILEFRGDIGGFGVGSDFAWQIHPRAGYRLSNLVELGLAYRVISMDYAGSGSPTFVYDLRTFGPEIGLVLHF